MPRKLTITLDDAVYEGLHRVVGARKISRFIENLVRPHVTGADDLEASYAAMAADEESEAEALEWANGLIGDVADEPG
jgi:predicted CopG family antitoxin